MHASAPFRNVILADTSETGPNNAERPSLQLSVPVLHVSQTMTHIHNMPACTITQLSFHNGTMSDRNWISNKTVFSLWIVIKKIGALMINGSAMSKAFGWRFDHLKF